MSYALTFQELMDSIFDGATVQKVDDRFGLLKYLEDNQAYLSFVEALERMVIEDASGNGTAAFIDRRIAGYKNSMAALAAQGDAVLGDRTGLGYELRHLQAAAAIYRHISEARGDTTHLFIKYYLAELDRLPEEVRALPVSFYQAAIGAYERLKNAPVPARGHAPPRHRAPGCH